MRQGLFYVKKKSERLSTKSDGIGVLMINQNLCSFHYHWIPATRLTAPFTISVMVLTSMPMAMPLPVCYGNE